MFVVHLLVGLFNGDINAVHELLRCTTMETSRMMAIMIAAER